MSSTDLADQTAVVEVKKDEFVSKCLPRTMGNALPIAYGGCTIAVAVHSACKSVDQGFHIFSVLGSFHGPTRIDRNIKCRVSRIRQTRTFASRRVVAYQTQDDGSDRTCADLFVDFHVSEKGMFEYSAPPSKEFRSSPSDPLKTGSRLDIVKKAVEDGQVSREKAKAHSVFFTMMEEYFEIRDCLDGVTGQNIWGLLKNLVTTQDHLPTYDKTAAEWFKARKPLRNEAESIAALAFAMDGAISFLPLNLEHRDLGDAGACSTLDFALRILAPEVRIDSWLLRERRAIAAHDSKTYSEARLWDESGKMVAVMSQTSICRPPNKPTKSGTKL